MAGGGRATATHRPLFFTSYRVFASAIFTLLFLASLSVLLRSNTIIAPDEHQSDPDNDTSSPFSSARRSFLSLPSSSSSSSSDPLRARASLLRRHASDHLALIHAYSSLARRLKLSSSRSLSTFQDLSLSLSSLASKISSSPLDDDSLRLLEKESKDKIKIARQIISESKESFDTQLKIQKLRDTIFAVNEQLSKAKKLGSLSGHIAAGSTPKSIHCLNMRLMEDLISHPAKYKHLLTNPNILDLAADPELYHYAIFSNNVIAVSTVVNSAITNAEEPYKHVFHVVTDKMYMAAMRVWFARRPPASGARVEVRSVSEFGFLNKTYSPVVRMVVEEGGRRDLDVLEYSRFYLPEMFPKLRRVVLLEDDVVVQKDLAGLWSVELDGKVNGAVEMCFGGFQRYNKYMNFSNPAVRERFSPRACAWGFGVNVFDLDAWRREQCTEQFHRYQNLNEDGKLWNPGRVLPAGLMTFYTTTKPIDKSWHVMGLGYNPSVSQDEIHNAAVIHFNGNMKPWLDVAMNQYKHLWTKYVDTEMEFLPLCNFGL